VYSDQWCKYSVSLVYIDQWCKYSVSLVYSDQWWEVRLSIYIIDRCTQVRRSIYIIDRCTQVRRIIYIIDRWYTESLQSKDISIKSDEEKTEESLKTPASSQQKMTTEQEPSKGAGLLLRLCVFWRGSSICCFFFIGLSRYANWRIFRPWTCEFNYRNQALWLNFSIKITVFIINFYPWVVDWPQAPPIINHWLRQVLSP
jgi:hypothetical protein